MWVEPDFNLPDGETTVRELLLGQRYAKEHLGADVHVGWNPDSFGFSWQLPQIYRKSGIDSFMTQKMTWNETNQLPFRLFWWQSPDGSKVLTYFGKDQNSSFRVAPLSRTSSPWTSLPRGRTLQCQSMEWAITAVASPGRCSMRRSNGPRQQPSSRRRRLQLPESSSRVLRRWLTHLQLRGTIGRSQPE